MNRLMRALVLNNGKLELQDRPIPVPAKGEALIRVQMAGICNTDLELAKGYMNFNGIPGHEFVGVVEDAGSSHWVGRRVVGEINCACHACRFCYLEMPHHCEQRNVLGILNRDGAFAEYLTLPEENLHEVPSDMPDDVAVFCEPVAAAFRITEQVNITQEDTVVVLGDGKLGLLITQVLSHKTKKLTCLGKHARNLAILDNLGIKTSIFDEYDAEGADYVIDATGTASGFNTALRLLRPEGTLILKSTVAGATPFDMSLPVINETRIIGSRCGPFRPALEALALGNVDVKPMLETSYTLSDVVNAFEHAAVHGALKVLILFD